MAARVVFTSFLLLVSMALSSAVRDGMMMDSKMENEQSEVGAGGNLGGHVGFEAPGVSIGGNIGGAIGISGGSRCNNGGSGNCGNNGGSNGGGGCSSGNCGQYQPPNCAGCFPVAMPPYNYYNQPLYCVPSSCPTNQCPGVTLQFSEVASVTAATDMSVPVPVASIPGSVPAMSTVPSQKP